MNGDLTCGACLAGKHGHCNGEAFDDDLNQPGLCQCGEADHHGLHFVACPWCPELMPAAELNTHMALDHNYRPSSRKRGIDRPLRDVDAEAADRESDRLDHINESRLP